MIGCYELKVGLLYNNSYNSREPVEDLLESNALSAKSRQKLSQVAKIINYAHLEGLNVSGAYKTLIQETHKIYLLQVAFSDRLKWKKWPYVLLGSLPYRGYFSHKERNREAQKFEALGFDTFQGEVAAFSGLGWFEDPLFYSMLERSEPFLAKLLFHELTHKSIWIAGEPEFNEHLASFVSRVLTEKYLKNVVKDQQKLQRFLAIEEDKKKYSSWIKSLRDDLKGYYESVRNDPLAEVLRGKQRIFKEYLTAKRPHFSRYDYIKGKDWNNAAVLAGLLYLPDMTSMYKYYNCSRAENFGVFFRKVKESFTQNKEAKEAMMSLCSVERLR